MSYSEYLHLMWFLTGAAFSTSAGILLLLRSQWFARRRAKLGGQGVPWILRGVCYLTLGLAPLTAVGLTVERHTQLLVLGTACSDEKVTFWDVTDQCGSAATSNAVHTCMAALDRSTPEIPLESLTRYRLHRHIDLLLSPGTRSVYRREFCSDELKGALQYLRLEVTTDAMGLAHRIEVLERFTP